MYTESAYEGTRRRSITPTRAGLEGEKGFWRRAWFLGWSGVEGRSGSLLRTPGTVLLLARAVSGERETQAGLCWIEKESAMEQGRAACRLAPVALWSGGQWCLALGTGARTAGC